MRGKGIGLLIANILVIGLLIVYLVNPGGDLEFNLGYEKANNFSLGNNSVQMQFYENMRFPDSRISYKIDDECSLKKRNSMERAFRIMENETILMFYESNRNPEIYVSCQDRQVSDNGLFIAGEGGPTNITDTNQFRVIFNGEILLIRDSDCATPNVEIHELLHVLGFDHSDNDNNIMYPISKCKQTIGTEIVELIDEIYGVPKLPDLKIENASAEINGRSLSVSFSVRNEGIAKSENAIVKIFSDDKTLKEIELDSLEIGHGVKIELANIWLTKIKIEELGIVIDSDFDELSIENNKVLLSKII